MVIAVPPSEVAVRPARLRVIEGATVLERLDDARTFRAWEPKPGLPGQTRASCPSGPCPYVKCRHHLANLEGELTAGRPWPGFTKPSILVPLWLDADAPTCSLRVAERIATTGEPMPVADVGRTLRIRERQTHMALSRALAKVGVSKADVTPLVRDATPDVDGLEARRDRVRRHQRAHLGARIVEAIARLHAHGLAGECSRHGISERFGPHGVELANRLVEQGRLRIVEIVVHELGCTKRRRVFAPVSERSRETGEAVK